MKNKKLAKIFTVAMALVLVAACSVGATLAYLTAKADTVTNTFVAGKIIIDEDDFVLQEHQAVAALDQDQKPKGTGFYALNSTLVQTNEYVVVPGVDLPKDPFVKVTPAANAYVYIAVSSTLPEGMSYKIDGTQWTELKNGDEQVKNAQGDLIYTAKAGVLAPAVTQTLNILDGKTVTVTGQFNPSKLEVSPETAKKALTFNAYLVQAGSFENALAAWQGANFQ